MKKNFTDDNQLFHALREHDEEAVIQYHRNKYPGLCYFTISLVNDKEIAENIATDAFCETVYESKKEFNDLQHMTAYMYIRARWKCQDHKKKKPPPSSAPLETIEFSVAGDHNIEDDYNRSEFYNAFVAEVNKLPREKDRNILKLYLEGLTPVEIARQIGESDGYVRNRIKELCKKIGIELINRKIITVLLLLFSLNNSI